MSDQDFFFDDEPQAKPAAKGSAGAKGPAAAKSASTAKAGAPARQAAPATGSFFAQSVSMAITSLVAVIALLVGLIVGLLIPTGGSAVPTTSPAASTAPSLTQDQLNSGELPAGHPDIGGTTTESATATGTGN